MARATSFLKVWSRRVAPLAAVMALGGCTTLDAVNALQPRNGVGVIQDLSYGEGPRRKLDVYTPPGDRKSAPLVVFFYGGGWETGDRKDYRFVGTALAAKGFVVIVPDYRLYPEARWPAFLQDGAQAVRWARDHAGQYGGDPGKLVLMGHSAGAYNAAMLAVDDRWLTGVGLDPTRDVRALVGISGPYDFLPLRSEVLKAVFGPETQRPATQPVNQNLAGAPPAWLGTGGADKVVMPRNTESLAAKLRAANVPVETHLYPRLGHGLTIGAFAGPLRLAAPVLKDVSGFIASHTSDRP
ncbi:MAG: alpha/beta hydrolase [Caulobacter sp.]